MKKQITNKIVLSTLIILLGLSASAGTRLCYTQNEDADGIFKDILASVSIADDDFENHIILQEDDQIYSAQALKNGHVTVAMFDQKNKNSLVIATSNGIDGITLINESLKKLVACLPVQP